MVLGGWGLSPCSADGLRLGQSDLTEYACIRRNRVGEGEARPTGLHRTVKGREGGVVRPAARHARGHGPPGRRRRRRRLPIDRPGQVCWADQKEMKCRRGRGERGPARVDPQSRPLIQIGTRGQRGPPNDLRPSAFPARAGGDLGSGRPGRSILRTERAPTERRDVSRLWESCAAASPPQYLTAGTARRRGDA